MSHWLPLLLPVHLDTMCHQVFCQACRLCPVFGWYVGRYGERVPQVYFNSWINFVFEYFVTHFFHACDFTCRPMLLPRFLMLAMLSCQEGNLPVSCKYSCQYYILLFLPVFLCVPVSMAMYLCYKLSWRGCTRFLLPVSSVAYHTFPLTRAFKKSFIDAYNSFCSCSCQDSFSLWKQPIYACHQC